MDYETEEVTEMEDIWQDAWHSHSHPEYSRSDHCGNEVILTHYHSPDSRWGVGFSFVFSLMGEVRDMSREELDEVCRYFEIRLARLRHIRDRISLPDYPAAVRQGLVLEFAGAENMMEGMMALIGEVRDSLPVS